ncbi:MAG: hypothetical protein H7338_14900, partial [Candidatus Sericytochromatia bacterium]|nr:hypothetical protein [Candidatus Sericytochromatia bacterium]
MQIVRQLPSLACLVLGVAIGCAPAMPPMPATVSTLTAAATTAGYRYEGVADPLTHAVTISPVGFKSQVTGVFVRSANAVWNGGTSTFSFDLLVTNNSGGALSTVRGVVLSTTPGSPTVMAAGTSGTLVGGQPYYNYGTLANAATGTVNVV